MGCISVHTSRIGGNLFVDTARIGGGLSIGTTRIGGTCHVTTSLICSINVANGYVRVEPKFIWLTESNNYTEIVEVFSNTDWKAK